MVLNIAHRGYKEVTPENTLAAFAAAVAVGADMIETDIHVCNSGEIVIMHDDDVTATSNGSGHISEMTLTELQQLDVGSWFAPAFTGQRIVTLPELVEFFATHPQVQLLLEFKGEWSVPDCRRVIEQLNSKNLQDRTVLESFETQTMANLQEVAPAYRRGLLIDQRFDENPSLAALLAECADLGVMCLNPAVRLLELHPELVAKCHSAGLQVMVWTADQPAEFEQLVELGVEAICTNRPGFLAGWLVGRGLTT